MISTLQQEVIWPVARVLFPKEAHQFDDHHSFIVRYQAGEDLGLDMHTDDSDVTFNVCLGHDFTGATLSFCGNFGAPQHRKLTHTYSHEVGRCVVHLGSRRHGADDIASGQRINLIVWSKNNDWRSSQAYQQRRAVYQREEALPDPVCLSFTHDKDFEKHRVPTAEEQKRRNKVKPWCPPKGMEYQYSPLTSGAVKASTTVTIVNPTT